MAIQAAGIEIKSSTIGVILQEKNLCVPLSQRSYRWEAEHVDDLYKDINAALLANLDEYFLGSVVVIKSQGKTYVYDGQQRLATSMILVSAIRDYFLESGDEETARLIEDETLFSKHRRTHEETPHFKLNAEDHQFFHNRILLRPDNVERKATEVQRDSHKRIEKARKLAKEFVRTTITAGLQATKASDHLHRWLDFIKDSLRVIWVQVSDERTAFTIFETMNDRGLKLSSADLLKNHLYAIADDRRDEVIQKWQSMTAVLETIEGEEENVVEYVRCFWVTGHGHTRTKVLYDKIKEKTTNKSKALALASELEDASQDYAAILLSSHEKLASRGQNVRTKIEVLRSLGVTQLRPLLLAAFRKFSQKEFDKLLDACVSWSVRTLLSGVPSGTIEDYYARNAFEITTNKIKKTSDVKSDLAKIIPDDTRFKMAVTTAHVANHHLARYYLRALQRCADGQREPQYIPNPGAEVTLEHILPARPGENWKHMTPEEQRANLNRLGNQVLLSATVNSKLGNASFDVKKLALNAADFSLTREAAVFGSWGVAEIATRQKRLADLAVNTWPLK
jgi:uncharacterized protein with ParB-like and HNH nuclease domain